MSSVGCSRTWLRSLYIFGDKHLNRRKFQIAKKNRSISREASDSLATTLSRCLTYGLNSHIFCRGYPGKPPSSVWH